MNKTTVIAIANNKGGTGKTSTACNLAYGLSRKLRGSNGQVNGGVLLVDLDPQGNVADFFGIREMVYDEFNNPDGRCVSFILMGEDPLKPHLIPIRRGEEATNLYMIPASRALEYTSSVLDRDEHNRRIDMERTGRSRLTPLDEVLDAALGPALGLFRYIILDCPPKLDVLKRAVYHFADYVIVPTKAEHISVAGTVEHTQDLERLISEDPDHYKARIFCILPTMVNGREVADRQMRQSLTDLYGPELMGAPIPDSVKVKESSGAGGLSVFEYDPQSAPALAYARLVNGVYNRV